MKILIFTGIFEPDIGGPAIYTPKLAKQFTDSNHEVSVVTYSQKKFYDSDNKYHFKLKRIKRINPIINRIKMFLVACQNLRRFEVVYVLDYMAVGLPISIAAKLMRKKYIVRVGGDYLWEKYMWTSKIPVTLRDFYYKKMYQNNSLLYRMIKFVLQGADKIIFNNDGLGEVYTKAFGLDKSRHEVVFNPIPVVKQIASNTADNKEIIFAGRLIPLKNLKNLIKAFTKINNNNFVLKIIGDGPEQEELNHLVESQKLTDKIQIEPPIGKDELLQRLLKCYLLILPSYSDINPNLVTECLAMQVPFVVTKETFLPYRDKLPLVFDPNDNEQILHTLDYLLDRDNYVSYASKLSKIKWKYSWEDCAKDHLTIFQK